MWGISLRRSQQKLMQQQQQRAAPAKNASEATLRNARKLGLPPPEACVSLRRLILAHAKLQHISTRCPLRTNSVMKSAVPFVGLAALRVQENRRPHQVDQCVSA